MTDTIGYIVMSNPRTGAQGIAYDYIFSADGTYIQSTSPLLTARIMVAEYELRGLQPVTEKVVLEHGLIPGLLMELVLDAMLANPRAELFAAIRWDGESYGVVLPQQTRGAASVEYEKVPDTVLEIHSHANMRAFFSMTDDQDEQGFMLYLVVGKLDQLEMEMSCRIGIYGYFSPVGWPEVFSGPLPSAVKQVNVGGSTDE